MSQQQRRLHITFTYSAAHSLKLALRRLGIEEEVLPLGDDLSVGPIEPGDAAQRLAWENAAWQSCARVVGDTMGTVWSGRLQEFHSDNPQLSPSSRMTASTPSPTPSSVWRSCEAR